MVQRRLKAVRRPKAAREASAGTSPNGALVGTGPVVSASAVSTGVPVAVTTGVVSAVKAGVTFAVRVAFAVVFGAAAGGETATR